MSQSEVKCQLGMSKRIIKIILLILQYRIIVSAITLDDEGVANIANAADDVLSDEERLIKEKFTCSPKVCSGRGLCYLNELHKVSCHCYAQYYHGLNCSELSDTCDTIHMREVAWIPSCQNPNTKVCWAVFGMNYCECHENYMDRTCSRLYNPYEYGADPKYRSIEFPVSPIALMILEPTVHTDFHIQFGVVAHKNVSHYEFAIEGISYRHKKQDFKAGDVNSLESLKEIKTFLGNEHVREYLLLTLCYSSII